MINMVTVSFVAIFAGLALLDTLHQARRFPRVRFWRLRGVLALFAFLGVAVTAPLLWDAWLAEHRLFDATALPFALQVALGLLVYELGTYAWHRTIHESDVIWRHVHQTHHSAERIDIWSAFWFHPLDMLGWSLLGSLCLVGAVGLTPQATIMVVIGTSFLTMFQHANVKTPHWLGWFIQRPEMHSVHHQRGVHRFNYSDLPVLDMLFGTYRNPKSWDAEAGFFDGSSNRLWPLLIGRKIA
ncbi:MAG TPA: sterol desaturase family protein [Caulobacteraceae bacterium]|jgi:sterol desaturase/sphingolipid hydroxylase (fatty acid hydroxylase superfamily)